MSRLQQITRSILLRIRGEHHFFVPYEVTTQDGDNVQAMIYRMLCSDAPCMIARFGSVELQAVIDSLYPATMGNAIRFLRKEIPSWGYAPSTIRTMRINAGFFPSNADTLDRFARLMIESMAETDVIGSWRPEEAWIDSHISHTTKVALPDLEPYYFDKPWTKALAGKTVLVIHPFENTIRNQHGRQKMLYTNPDMAPSFRLETIKAVQSIAGNTPEGFHDWFEALEWMKHEIDKKDFDIAIIGCGAYGFPLAAYIKRKGKKAIHLGGATANLFGILSTSSRNNEKLSPLINEYWVNPSADETPKNYKIVENGRYW